MFGGKYKKNIFYSLLILLLISVLYLFYFYFIKDNFKKDKKLAIQPLSINLLTSVHPNLHWNFKPIESKIVIKPGEVITIEYMVENLGNNETTGIATFAYFPSEIGNYISKINCFCYDAKTLKPKEKDRYTLIILIDPQVTKDTKTKNVKEATIQFTFFDYKEYKEQKS